MRTSRAPGPASRFPTSCSNTCGRSARLTRIRTRFWPPGKPCKSIPDHPKAHTAIAYIHEHYEWNWTEADRELTQALTLDPSYELARQWYSYGLLRRGDAQRAVAEMRRALTLDPASFRVNVTMAERLERAGQHDEAVRQYLTAID